MDEDDIPLGVIAGQTKLRRGSEGWEVRPLSGADREDIVRRWVAQDESRAVRHQDLSAMDDDDGDDDEGGGEIPLLAPPDRYKRYVPEVSSEEETSSEGAQSDFERDDSAFVTVE